MPQVTSTASSDNDDDGTEPGWGDFTEDLYSDDTFYIRPDQQTGGAYWFYSGFTFTGLESGDTIDDVEIIVRGYDSFGDGGWALGFYWDDSTTNVVATAISGKTICRIPETGYGDRDWET